MPSGIRKMQKFCLKYNPAVNAKPNSLGRSERLKSRKLIEKLFSEGRSINMYPLRMLYLPGEKEEVPLQAGFGVGARKFGRAVDRNRIRRLMREAYRVSKAPLLGTLLAAGRSLRIFFIYTGKEIESYDIIHEKMKAAIMSLGTMVSGKK